MPTATPTYTVAATMPVAPMEAILVVQDTPTATRTSETAAQSTCDEDSQPPKLTQGFLVSTSMMVLQAKD